MVLAISLLQLFPDQQPSRELTQPHLSIEDTPKELCQIFCRAMNRA